MSENLFDLTPTREQELQDEKEKLDAMQKKRSGKICIDGTNFYEALSAWIKECRLGNLSRAMYWAIVLVRTDAAWFGKRICAFAGEEISPYDLQSYTAMMTTGMSMQQRCFGKANGEECARYITIVACMARKFFEDGEMARKFEACMRGAEGAIDRGWKLKIPTYALDMHTRAGKKKGKPVYTKKEAENGGCDCRYSGDAGGRLNMIQEFEEHGKLLESFPEKTQPPLKTDWR